ncbi:MAG: tetratricopeptide repeat protein [Polyangiaceae bacterium]
MSASVQELFDRGVQVLVDDRLDEAVELLGRAVALAPGHAGSLANLGEALRRRGDLRAAFDALVRAVGIDAQLFPAVYNLGSVLEALGAMDGALACFERAAELQPGLSAATERLEAARASVAARNPDDSREPPADESGAMAAATLLTLARPLAMQGRLEDAVRLLERAVKLRPGLTPAYCNLAMLEAALGRIEEACANYRRALEIEPDRADVHHGLGVALLRGGRLDEAIGTLREAAAAKPGDAAYASDVVFHLHFHPAHDGATILAEARAWDRAHGDGAVDRVALRTRAPDRRIRVGYVSPNFRRHCQAFFLFPLLAHHDHDRFEIHCYSDVARPDEWTGRLLALADHAYGVSGMSHAELAERIAADGIDVLVDLTMHMADGRLPVFARRPAPVQVCWLAYPGTTGLAAMDYRVTDPYLDPDDAGPYTERPLVLPETFWCYDPLEVLPAPGSLPARERGCVTFGSLNNVLKVHEGVVDVWARVLLSVPRSTITLLAPAGEARGATLGRFEARGVAPDRVRFVEYQARQAYLETYRGIDVALDTFPYNGHTTSLDALWMGVPVVTLVGPTVVGRAGLSQAMNLGLPELVARDADRFVEVAVGLSADLEHLASLRDELRGRMERSPLMDAARFARNLEAAFVGACA